MVNNILQKLTTIYCGQSWLIEIITLNLIQFYSSTILQVFWSFFELKCPIFFFVPRTEKYWNTQIIILIWYNFLCFEQIALLPQSRGSVYILNTVKNILIRDWWGSISLFYVILQDVLVNCNIPSPLCNENEQIFRHSFLRILAIDAYEVRSTIIFLTPPYILIISRFSHNF